MELKFVYKGDKVYNAPLDIIDDVGMIRIWEEPKFDCFLVMPLKLVVGRGEVIDENRKFKVLKKSEGWEAVYEL